MEPITGIQFSNQRVFVMGASGRVGSEVVRALRGKALVRAGGREVHPTKDHIEWVRFNLEDPSTFEAAIADVDSMFLMRPPQIVKTKGFEGLLKLAKFKGIRRVVFLSVAGAERNPILPHHAFEKSILKAGFQSTMIRPADFMQNLETVHLDSIRARDEIAVPAGDGRSPFIDVLDVGAVIAKVILEVGHENRGYTLTGPVSLSFTDLTKTLTEVLGRRIRFRPVGVFQFLREQRKLGASIPITLVMSALYSIQKWGWAPKVTGEVKQILGRDPTSLREYVVRNQQLWTSNSL